VGRTSTSAPDLQVRLPSALPASTRIGVAGINGLRKRSKSSLNLKTPFNFVATADIHGGNSGSATLNSKGEIIGILFDTNLEALPNRFVYTDRQARSVHVASQGIVEALQRIYGATDLLKELGF